MQLIHATVGNRTIPCMPSIEYSERTNLTNRDKLIFLLPFTDLRRGSEIKTSISLRFEEDIKLLETIYTFKNLKEIKKFLWTHKELVETLFEAHKQIERVFKDDIVEVYLEYDRDLEEDFEGLFVIVKTNLSPESSLDLLDKFDEEWWLDIDNETRTILAVMVRPI